MSNRRRRLAAGSFPVSGSPRTARLGSARWSALAAAAVAALLATSPLAAQIAVGPIGFDEAEFPPDAGFTTLRVPSLDGVPIPPLLIESGAGFLFPTTFLADLEDLIVTSMSDPVLYVNATQPLTLDFGGEVSGVTFLAQIFAFSNQSGFADFLSGTLRFRALAANGAEVATGSAPLPFDGETEPINIGRPVSFASPAPFRRLEITVETPSGTTFQILLVDELAYAVTGDVPVDLFDEVPLSATGTAPAAASDPNGRRVVTWIEPGRGTLLAQVFGADDAALSSVFVVNAGSQATGTPAVAFDARGNLIFAWQSGDGDGAAPGGRQASGLVASSIVSRPFSPQGLPQAGETPISQGSDAGAPSVDASSGGDAVVTWQSGGKIKGRKVGTTGAGGGPIFDVSDGAGQSAGRVAVAASGDFAVVWSETVGGVPAVFARFFRADGTPKGARQRVSAEGAGAATSPAIASDALGNVVVVWQQATGEGFDVLVRRYDSNGASRGSSQRAHGSAAGDQTAPSVSANATGDFVIAWESEGGNGAGVAGRWPSAAGTGGSIVARGFSPAGAGGAEVEVATVEAGATPKAPKVTIADDDEITVAFERKGSGGAPRGVFTRRLETALPTTPCVESAERLCLAGGRFGVRVTWRDFEGNTGIASVTPLTSDTGAFWFFDQANVEIVAKVLDARGVNGFFWVFYGALSNVEYTLTVEDSVTGNSRTYFNPLGAFGSRGDTSALPGAATTGADAVRLTGRRDDVAALARAEELRLAAAACTNTGSKLCLQQSRFEVSVTWRNFEGGTGGGTAIPLSPDTGYFWFFDDANVELVVKVLDARGVNGRFWVFYGALSNVEYTITVRDTETGNTKTYTNPLGTFGSVGDTEGLPGS